MKKKSSIYLSVVPESKPPTSHSSAKPFVSFSTLPLPQKVFISGSKQIFALRDKTFPIRRREHGEKRC